MLATKLFSELFLPLSIALIMYGMGLSLTVLDFRRIVLRPREVLLGLVAQMILLPLFAFLLAWVAPVSAPLKVGIFLVAVCPGGATSNLINYLLNGNLALCVSLTTVNAFLTQFTIPLLLSFGVYFFMGRGAEVNLPFWRAVFEIFTVTLLPVFLGITTRNQFPNFAEKVRKPLKYLMPVPLGISMVGAAFLEKSEVAVPLVMDYLQVIPWLILLNVGSFWWAWKYGGWLRLGPRTALTIAIEVGLQNTAMALMIAAGRSFAAFPQVAVPAALYAMFSLFSTAGMGWWLAKKIKKEKLADKKSISPG